MVEIRLLEFSLIQFNGSPVHYMPSVARQLILMTAVRFWVSVSMYIYIIYIYIYICMYVRKITGRRRTMLMARVWRFHAFTLPCTGKPRNCLSYYLWRRLQTARTAVYHSTGFLQRHNSHKRFLKKPRDRRCPFPGNTSIELAVFKATTSNKRVLNMPLEAAVVSIS